MKETDGGAYLRPSDHCIISLQRVATSRRCPFRRSQRRRVRRI